MKYDLSDKDSRKHFLRYANRLLANQRNCVELVDESNRTQNQNKYIHVLCRILANEIGVTEAYAKQVYFKQLANREIFVTTSKDPLTNELIEITRSTCDLTIPEMRKAISRFRAWASEQGYYLPEADVNDDGTVSFASELDSAAFHQAEILTSSY